MLEFIYFLGNKPEIRVNSKSRHKTTIVGLISLISIALIMSISIYFTNHMLSRKKLVINTKENYETIPQFNLTDQVFAFHLVDSMSGQIKDPDRIFNLTPIYWTKNDQDVWAMYRIPFGKCNLIEFTESDQTLLKDYPAFDTFYFINKQGLENLGSIYGVNGENTNGFSLAMVYINKCINYSIENNCLPEEEIVENLGFVFFDIIYQDYIFDYSNFDQPVSVFKNANSFKLSTSIFTSIYSFFQKSSIITDAGFIFESEYQEYINGIKEITVSVDNRPESSKVFPGNFGAIYISNSKKGIEIKRNYMKAQELLANIGGILKGIYFLASLLQYLLAGDLYYLDFAEKIFSSKSSIDEKEKKNINSVNNYNFSKIIEFSSAPKTNQKYSENNIIKKSSLIGIVNKFNINSNTKEDVEEKAFKLVELIKNTKSFNKKNIDS